MAPDSATVSGPSGPASSTMTGDLPSGWMARSSGGASIVFGSRG